MHAKARLRDLEAFCVHLRERLDQGSLAGISTSAPALALRMLERTIDHDAMMEFFQREIGA